MREHAMEIFREAVRSVQPQYLIPKKLRLEKDRLQVGDREMALSGDERLWVIGAGKASAAMALETEKILGDHITGGLIITKYDHCLPLRIILCRESGHPVPDKHSVQYGEELLKLAKPANKNDIILALISGGASALLADHPPGVTLNEIQELSGALLRCGAEIREINIVRKHLSPRIKGGQLAKQFYPANICSLIISDVIGDPLDSIASGMTVPDPSTYLDAWNILEKYNLSTSLSSGIHYFFQDALVGKIPETPKSGDPVFEKVSNELIGTNRIALDAAFAHAKKLGYHPEIITDCMIGEARDQAEKLVDRIIQYKGKRPACLLMGGETTVTLRGKGKGGRNQEFVLAALFHWKEKSPARPMPVILSAGTDGTDGPTDAAGAIMDHRLMERVGKEKTYLEKYLHNNDSYPFFKKMESLIITGPTQTNVMDIVVALLY